MSSKNTKAAKKVAKISAMFGGKSVQDVADRCQAVLAIDNRLRKPETASTSTIKCSLHSAKATTSRRAKKPFIFVK